MYTGQEHRKVIMRRTLQNLRKEETVGKEVTIKISPDGSEVEIDANGFVGGSCKDFMKGVITMGTVIEEEKKPSYYLTERGGQKIGAL